MSEERLTENEKACLKHRSKMFLGFQSIHCKLTNTSICQSYSCYKDCPVYGEWIENKKPETEANVPRGTDDMDMFIVVFSNKYFTPFKTLPNRGIFAPDAVCYETREDVLMIDLLDMFSGTTLNNKNFKKVW